MSQNLRFNLEDVSQIIIASFALAIIISMLSSMGAIIVDGFDKE